MTPSSTIRRIAAQARPRTTDRAEEREQARLVRWSHLQSVRALIPELAYLHHSPNGGQRSAFTGAQMKALGVKRGFPDLILPMAGRSLAIEMKSATGRTSPDQDGWLDWLARSGWTIAVCRSAEDARDAIAVHFGLALASLPGLD